MSELIKREDAINAVAELQGIAQSKAELTGISKAWKRIKALPTVDAVPVVRCGECNHYHDDDDPPYCDELCTIHVEKTDGCLRGIKRGAEVGYRAEDGEKKKGERK